MRCQCSYIGVNTVFTETDTNRVPAFFSSGFRTDITLSHSGFLFDSQDFFYINRTLLFKLCAQHSFLNPMWHKLPVY